MAILVVMILFNMGETIWELRSIQHEYDPLGEFPEQEVLNANKQVAAGGTAIIKGTKCNDTDERVIISGELRWTAVDPPGTSFLVLAGVGDLPPGCETNVFRNPVPEEVAELAADGLVMWQVIGTNWPIDEDGNRGRPRDFRSEAFEVVP